MLRTLLALIALPGFALAESYETSHGTVDVTQIAGDIENGWAFAFLPNGEILVTERGGTLWMINDLGRERVRGVPTVFAQRQGGLLDIALAHDFETSNRVYLTYAKDRGLGESSTAVAAATFDRFGPGLHDVTELFVQDPPVRSGRHYGSRIVVAQNGDLWVTFGDRGERPEAQDPANAIGSIIRITPQGAPSADNPIVQPDNAIPETWSYGHRNVQGATMAQDGSLWTVEHGARGGDELNHPQPGLNYGWPIISYGTHYSGGRIGSGTARDGMEQPVHYWDPSIAPSGLTSYAGSLFPDWQGDLFVGALAGQMIVRLDMEDGRVMAEEELFAGDYGRVRDVRTGPDGAIWFLTDASDGALYRVTPN
jgi:glucose/arabinose dehydrogenase